MEFSWKVLQPNTMRSYTVAAKDYEKFAGKSVSQADAESILAWQKDMEQRGLTVGTIHFRLSAVGTISGVKVELPKRVKSECCKTLSLEQVRLFFSVIKSRTDRALMASIFFTGSQPYTMPAHFAGLGMSDGSRLTTQEITRRVKRYAKMAGLNEAEMNLRTMKRSGKILMDEQGTLELLKVTTPSPSKDRNRISYRPLHGIGRRSHMTKA